MKIMKYWKEKLLNIIIQKCSKKLRDGNGTFYCTTMDSIINTVKNGRTDSRKHLEGYIKMYYESDPTECVKN